MYTLYIVAVVIGVIGMCVRALRSMQHEPQRLRTVVLLPLLAALVGVGYAYLLADKAFTGFVWLLQFGLLSDLLMYFIGLNLLIAILSVPAIPWLLSSAAVRARVCGGALCVFVAIWIPFCHEFTVPASR